MHNLAYSSQSGNGGFRYLKRGESCPVCGGRKHCRSRHQDGLTTYYCHEHISGECGNSYFRYLGESTGGTDGVFGKHVVREEYESNRKSRRDDYYDDRGIFDKTLVKRAKTKEEGRTDNPPEIEPVVRCPTTGFDRLSMYERDEEYRELIEEPILQLTEKHKEAFKERGYSEGIIQALEEYGVRTWTPNRSLSRAYPIMLPGVVDRGGAAGKNLASPCGRYIPQKMVESLGLGMGVKEMFVGGQLMPDDITLPKYKHFVHPQLPEFNSMPVTVCIPSDEEKIKKAIDRNTIFLIEGTLKPFVAGYISAGVFIGTGGGTLFPKEALKHQLWHLTNGLWAGKKPAIRIALDAGFRDNPSVAKNMYENALFVEGLGYEVHFLYWGQGEKRKGEANDFDDILLEDNEEKLKGVQRITRKEFLDKLEPSVRERALNINRLNGFAVNRNFIQVQPGIDISTRLYEPLRVAPLVYKPEDRMKVWKEYTEKYQIVVDISGVGSGKSHTAGLIQPVTDFDHIEKVIYFTESPLNVTVETLKTEEWSVLQGRAIGYTWKDTHGGKNLRVSQPGDKIDVQGTCHRAHEVAELARRNIQPGRGTICKGCPYRDGCMNGTNTDGNDYIWKKKQAFESSKIITHPLSIRQDDYTQKDGLPKTLAIYDEFSKIFPAIASIDVTIEDVRREVEALSEIILDEPFWDEPRDFTVEEAKKLRRLLLCFKSAIEESKENAETEEFGIDGNKARESVLGEHTSILDEIPEALLEFLAKREVNLSQDEMNVADGEDVKLGDLPSQYKKRFKKFIDFGKKREEKIQSYRTVFLKELVQVLKGGHTNLSLKNGIATLHLKNKSKIAELKSDVVRSVLILDATINIAALETMLGQKVFVIKQADKAEGDRATTKINQFPRLGIAGRGRSPLQKSIIDQFRKYTKEKLNNAVTIERLKYKKDGDLTLFSESRGSNRAKEALTLNCFSAPIPSQSALRTSYMLTYGYDPGDEDDERFYPYPGNPGLFRKSKEPKDEKFALFCRQAALAEIEQMFGRIRADIRPGEELVINFFSDYPLDIETNVTDFPYEYPDFVFQKDGEESDFKPLLADRGTEDLNCQDSDSLIEEKCLKPRNDETYAKNSDVLNIYSKTPEVGEVDLFNLPVSPLLEVRSPEPRSDEPDPNRDVGKNTYQNVQMGMGTMPNRDRWALNAPKPTTSPPTGPVVLPAIKKTQEEAPPEVFPDPNYVPPPPPRYVWAEVADRVYQDCLDFFEIGWGEAVEIMEDMKLQASEYNELIARFQADGLWNRLTPIAKKCITEMARQAAGFH